MKNFDSDAIGKAAPIDKWVAAMEQAFIDTAQGVVEVPPRVHLDRGPNTLLLMPCFGSTYFSTKLVSVFPKNLQKKEWFSRPRPRLAGRQARAPLMGHGKQRGRY